MCCHRVISLLQSALSPSRRRRVHDDVSTTANDVHQPQQVVLITTDVVEERGSRHRFIDQPMHLLCPWHVAHYARSTPPPGHIGTIGGRHS